MSDVRPPIVPSTKVAALLDDYPELEETLIAMAPPFVKLRNPVLRRSVAKVASLRQAAAVGRLPVSELVNRLRDAVGHKAMAFDDEDGQDSYLTSKPDWFDRGTVVTTVDERHTDDPDRMGITRVLPAVARLGQDEILELITPFLPAPGIDVLRGKGYRVWSLEESPDLIRTYVSKGT